MSNAELLDMIKIFGPSIAAYVSVRVGIAVATEKAREAAASARRAHERIDDHL
ncbi:hypothetical protein HUU62_04400, partial [Rhodoferax sp. 4810]|nr:hypothetical protein [Rhodoferax jenense]